MLPIRSRTIFRSRWMALLWAAGILWFAYDFVSSQPQSSSAQAGSENASNATGADEGTDDLNRLAQELNGF